MRTRNLFVLLSFAILVVGCAGPAPFTEARDGRSLVVGHIDMEEAPSDLDWLSLRQVAPKTDKPYWGTWTREGTFFHHNIPVGSFQVDSFGGRAWNTDYEYEVPRQAGADMRLRIDEPGIHFMGAFRYVEIDTAWYKPDAYDLARVDSPTEKQVLEALLPEAKGTSWELLIQKRLKELQ